MAIKCFNDVDPVCGMKLNGYAADFTEDFEGKTYGFCSQKCKDLFHGNPKKYTENPASHVGMPGPTQIPEKPTQIPEKPTQIPEKPTQIPEKPPQIPEKK